MFFRLIALSLNAFYRGRPGCCPKGGHRGPALQEYHKKYFLLFLLICGSSFAKAPNVVVTLKPIHSLVASIMDGVGEPALLLPDGTSPHTFQLKPSSLKAIQQADLIIWIGPSLETFMEKPLTLSSNQKRLTLLDIPGLKLLPQRRGDHWEHLHHDHDSLHSHQSIIDPHIWLSIENAITISNAIATQLSALDPIHADQYQQNAQQLKKRLETLKKNIKALLKSVHEPFLVYHDGYQYFEKEFGLNSVGTMMLNPHLPLSANRLYAITSLIEKNHITCIFRETEFNDTLIKNSLQRTVEVSELDPLGVHQPLGPNHYENTLWQLGKTFQACLQKKP